MATDVPWRHDRSRLRAVELVSTRRRQVAVYVVLVLALSFAFQAWMIRRAGGLAALGGLSAIVLMWIPALVALGMRSVAAEGFADAGFRRGPWRYWAWGYLGPLAFASFTYGAALATGVVGFEPKPSALSFESPVTRWLVLAALNASVGVAVANIASLGEELGWRGYLLTRLVEARLPRPLLVSGLIWGVWHLPLILWGDYATSSRPWLSAALFMICVTLAGVFFGWLRLASGSVWPAVIAHSSHNVFYQGVFDAHFQGELEPYLAGEQGVFSIVAYAAAVLWLWKSGRLARAPVIRAPSRAALVTGAALVLLACSAPPSEPARTPPAAPAKAAAPAPPTPPMPEVVPSRHAEALASAGLSPESLPPIEKLPKESVRPVMRLLSESTGLGCTGCHASKEDFVSDTPNKRIARRMWNDFVVPQQLKSGVLFCDSCHAGSAHTLVQHDRKAVSEYMKREYSGKLRTRDGNAVGCSTCHGDPFEPHVISETWGIEH